MIPTNYLSENKIDDMMSKTCSQRGYVLSIRIFTYIHLNF